MRFFILMIILVAACVYAEAALSETDLPHGGISGVALNLITPIQPGDESRNFSLMSTEGRMVSLEDFKGKSMVVLNISSPYG